MYVGVMLLGSFKAMIDIFPVVIIRGDVYFMDPNRWAGKDNCVAILYGLLHKLIVFLSKHQAKKTQDFHLTVGDSVVNAVYFVRNLGVYLDSSVTMDKQVNAVSRACCYQIRNIGCIRQFITTYACKKLVNSLVTSRLD